MTHYSSCKGYFILAGVRVPCCRCYPYEYKTQRRKALFVDGSEAKQKRERYRKKHGIPLDAPIYTRAKKVLAGTVGN